MLFRNCEKSFGYYGKPQNPLWDDLPAFGVRLLIRSRWDVKLDATFFDKRFLNLLLVGVLLQVDRLFVDLFSDFRGRLSRAVDQFRVYDLVHRVAQLVFVSLGVLVEHLALQHVIHALLLHFLPKVHHRRLLNDYTQTPQPVQSQSPGSCSSCAQGTDQGFAR